MMGGGYNSMPRHDFAMMSGIPGPYRSLSNALQRTRATVAHGAQVYQENCASCGGSTGAGYSGARPEPLSATGKLVWLSQMPTVPRDPFMYWSVAGGGTQFGAAMPAFKHTLP
jgi:hypothetical protein